MEAKHWVSTAYVPRSNGIVEAVCKEVLNVMLIVNGEIGISKFG